MLKVFEAFAGYGSQRMALKNLGVEHEVVAISEFDKYADASYQAIHGETWNMGDITKIDVDDVPDHDLFTYSFPCQDISVAGKGKGFSKDGGTRSGLLWESERIIKAKKPKYLLMENVKNLISEKFMPGFVEWILALEELGYSNYYEVLNAKDFGIPQNRERVFMVSILGEHEPYVFPKPIKLEKRLKDVLEEEVDEKYYLDNEKAEQLIATITEENNITNPTVVDATVNEPKVKEVMNTITARYDSGIDNYKSIGGAVVEPSFVVGSTQKNASVTDGSYSPTLTSSMGTGGGHVPMIDEPKIVDAIYNNRPPRVYSETSPTLRSERHGLDVFEPKIAASRGRNPENSSDRTKGAPTEQRLEVNDEGTSNALTTVQKDNYVVEPRAVKLQNSNMQGRRIKEPGEPMFTLSAHDRNAVTVGERVVEPNKHDISVLEGIPIKNDTNQGCLIAKEEFGRMGEQAVRTQNKLRLPHGETLNPWNEEQSSANGVAPTLTTRPEGFKTAINVTDQYRVRKLTPLECFRLMGVTDEDFYKAQAVNSNSQLYKQAGNSIVVSVLEAIFRNMFLEVPDEDLIGEHIPLF